MNTAIELQPTLIGKNILLRPLVADDFDALYKAASDPLVWEQHPDPLRYTKDVFTKNFFEGAIASKSAFAVVALPSQEIIGSSRYYSQHPIWQAQDDELAIGYTFLVRRHWGGATNGELKQLMLDHAFCWVKRVWFHIGEHNIRSRRAIEKIGGVYSHSENMVVNNISQPTACYFIDRPASPAGQ